MNTPAALEFTYDIIILRDSEESPQRMIEEQHNRESENRSGGECAGKEGSFFIVSLLGDDMTRHEARINEGRGIHISWTNS